MGKLIGLIIAAMLGFYVAWPAYTGYCIKNALDTGNADLLAAKIDFDGVRSTLKPAVTAEVEKAVTASLQQGGAANDALLQQLKTQLMPKVVETALAGVVTPETILRIYREGGDFKATLGKIIGEKTGGAGLGGLAGAAGASGGANGRFGDLLGDVSKAAGAAGIDPSKALGGLLGTTTAPAPAPAPAPAATAAKPQYSLANIKRFSMNGPLAFSVGIARDLAATEPDVTADVAFRGGDWKIVGLTPKI